MTLEEHDEKIKQAEERFGARFVELLDLVNAPSADALDLLWHDIVLKRDPNYGDWDYPGQAYRHLLAEYRDARKKALLDAAAAICPDCKSGYKLERRGVVGFVHTWLDTTSQSKPWPMVRLCDAAAIHELIELEAK